jgi:hypothetical protein
MESKVKITMEQIKAMHDHLSGLSFNDKRKREDLKLYYHLLTPKDVYVRYKSFSIEPDNSIHSKVDLQCIKPNGKKEDCGCHYDNLKQRLEFESGLMEIDLDANGKIVFI